MAQIKVTPEEMLQIAGQLEGEVVDWRGNVNKIYQHHAEMDSMWDGDANNAFNAVFLADRQKWDRLFSMTDEYVRAIREAANRYISCEQQVKQTVTRK